MTIPNAKLSDKLDALTNSMMQLVELQTAALEAKSEPVTDPSPNGGRSQDGTDVQPLLYSYFISKGSKSRKIIDTINGFLPGDEIKFARGCKGYINQAFTRSSYTSRKDGKAKGVDTWNEKTRSRINTRRTSKSGKTVKDGVSFRMTVPKWDAADNEVTVKRLS